MSDIESTDDSTPAEPTPAYGNPEPPYDGITIPDEYRNTPFEELPEGLQRRVSMLASQQGPSIGGSDVATGGGVDPAIAPPDTAGTV